MKIAMPNDAMAAIVKLLRPFHWEQTFTSASCDFTGTEREFVAAGHAYAYIDIDKHARRQVSA